MHRLADFVGRYRLLVAIVVVVATGISLVGIAQVQVDESPRNTIRRDDESFRTLERLYEDFGPDDNEILLAISGEQLFDPAILSLLRELIDRAQRIDGVEGVYSIFDLRRQGSRVVPLLPHSEAAPERFVEARQRALAHPLAAGHLLSADGRIMLVLVRMSGFDPSILKSYRVVDELRQHAADVEASSSLRIRLAGHAVVRADALVGIRREQIKLSSISILVAAAIGWLLFRRLSAVLITVAAPAVGLIWIMGLIGFSGLAISGLNMAIPTLVFVIGFTDAAHLMFDIRAAQRHGASNLDAALGAIRRIGPACALTSLTTAIGFASLAVANNPAVQKFGYACAVGAGCTFLSVILVTPLLASTRLGSNVMTGGHCLAGFDPRRLLTRVVWFSLRHPRAVTMAAIVGCLALATTALNLRSDIRWVETLPVEGETAQAFRICDQHFGGAVTATVTVQWPGNRSLSGEELGEVLAKVHQILEARPHLNHAFSIETMLSVMPGKSRTAQVKGLNRVPRTVLRRWLRTDLHRLVVTARVPDVGAAALAPDFTAVDHALQELQSRYPDYRFELTGTVVVAARNLQGVITDLARSLTVASLVVFIVMTLAFRSLRFGLVSVIPNAVPLLFLANVLLIMGEPLQLVSAITFCLCLGVAVDDTIHFIMRYRAELQHGRDRRSAILHSTNKVGLALVTTTLVLAGGFAVIMLSEIPALRLFAQLSSLATIVALLADLFVLPALLMLAGGKREARSRKS